MTHTTQMAKAIPYLDDLQRPTVRLGLLARWRARRSPRASVRVVSHAPVASAPLASASSMATVRP